MDYNYYKYRRHIYILIQVPYNMKYLQKYENEADLTKKCTVLMPWLNRFLLFHHNERE